MGSQRISFWTAFRWLRHAASFAAAVAEEEPASQMHAISKETLGSSNERTSSSPLCRSPPFQTYGRILDGGRPGKGECGRRLGLKAQDGRQCGNCVFWSAFLIPDSCHKQTQGLAVLHLGSVQVCFWKVNSYPSEKRKNCASCE